MTSSSSSTLVIGCASNLPAHHFLPFLRSLRRVGYGGRTCVFVSQMTSDDVAALQPLSDDIVDVDAFRAAAAPDWSVRILQLSKHMKGLRKHYPSLCRRVGRIVGVAPGNRVAEDLELRLEGLQSLRYAYYFAYLRDHPEFEYVMVSDLRDVIFQRDPFEHLPERLEVFLEDPSVTFATGGFNRRWFADLYGENVATRVDDRVVSCSGVTFGTREGMLAYLSAMEDEVGRHVPPLGPHDQAIHNWLLYEGRLGEPLVVENGYGRVLTMGAKSHIDVSTDGIVMNDDASVPAVLHQYDRHVALAHQLLAAY
jgi:hypothetical protein